MVQLFCMHVGAVRLDRLWCGYIRSYSQYSSSAISWEQFPSLWKSAIVHPLHKAGPTDICTNYRPNSILPAASKVMEMYVADLLKAHLEHNNLLYTLQ